MNEERFSAETKRIQSVITKASQKTGALSALSDGGKMSREKLQLTLEETAYFFESATLYLRTLCETQMPGAGGRGLGAYADRHASAALPVYARDLADRHGASAPDRVYAAHEFPPAFQADAFGDRRTQRRGWPARIRSGQQGVESRKQCAQRSGHRR